MHPGLKRYTHSLSKLKVTTFFGETYGISLASLYFEGCVSPPGSGGFFTMAKETPNPRDAALLGPFEGVVERIAFLGQWHVETETAGEM